MKKTVINLAIVSCFTLGASMVHSAGWYIPDYDVPETSDATAAPPATSGKPNYYSTTSPASNNPNRRQLADVMRTDRQREDKLFDAIDINGSGGITNGEFNAYFIKRFKEMDTDGTGKIERKEANLGKPENYRMFDDIDTDDDGMISESESFIHFDKLFKEMDFDNDRILTRAEMKFYTADPYRKQAPARPEADIPSKITNERSEDPGGS